MITVDDRTYAQKQTHINAIVADDKAMSGWGGAKGGTSKAAWAYRTLEEGEKVLYWVRTRNEMKNVTYARLDQYVAPKGVSHLHIYVVGEGHPALGK